MPFILISAFLLPICIVGSHLIKQKAIHVLPLSLMAIIVLQYIMGLFGALTFGVWALRITWVAACVFLAYVLATKKLAIKSTAVDILPVALVLAAMCWICCGRLFMAWDELSHWGIAIKGMFLENVLPSVTSLADGYKTYPPAISLLQYSLSSAVFIGYREDVALFIHAVLGFSMLIYPITFLNTLWKKLCFSGIMFLTPLVFFRSFYTETTMDAIMGAMFAFILVIYFFGTKSKFETALCTITAFVLTLVKSTGVAFAIFAVLIIAADVCFSTKFKQLKKKDILCFALPLAGAVLAKASWSIHLTVNNVAIRWNGSSFSLQALSDFIFKHEPSYRVLTAESFFSNMFVNRDYGFLLKFPYFTYAIIIVGIAFIFKRYLPDDKKQMLKRMMPAIYLMFFLYAAATLFSYLFVFSEYEAIYVASFVRYLGTFFEAIYIFLASMTVYILQKSNAKKSFALAVVSAMLIVAIAPTQIIYTIKELIFAPSATAFVVNFQSKYRKADLLIREVSNEKIRSVRLINQGDNEVTYPRMQYLAIPNTYKAIGSVSIYNEIPIIDAEEYSVQYSEKQLSDELYNNFEYVYIFSIKEHFDEEYPSLFYDIKDIHKNSLYKVEKQADGTVKLAYLKTAQLHKDFSD